MKMVRFLARLFAKIDRGFELGMAFLALQLISLWPPFLLRGFRPYVLCHPTDGEILGMALATRRIEVTEKRNGRVLTISTQTYWQCHTNFVALSPRGRQFLLASGRDIVMPTELRV